MTTEERLDALIEALISVETVYPSGMGHRARLESLRRPPAEAERCEPKPLCDDEHHHGRGVTVCIECLGELRRHDSAESTRRVEQGAAIDRLRAGEEGR